MLSRLYRIIIIGLFSSGLVYAQEEVKGTTIPDSLQATPVDAEHDPAQAYEELRRFARAFSLVKNQYVEPVSDKELIDAAIAGMVDKLDPHSAYLDKEDMIDLQEETDGEFGGLGIEIGEEKGYIKIISPIEGTPAAKAGVLPGDLVVSINDVNTKEKDISDVIKMLRGEPGSAVTLKVSRQGKLLDIHLKRELIKVKSVRSKLVGDIAYFRLSQFQTNTVNDLVAQIRSIKTTPKAIVLDLRNNPGGLLNVSVGVVQIFANTQGSIVSTKARNQVVEEFSRYIPDNILQNTAVLKNLPPWLHSVPMVVLINVGSASASEIVAGALQDFKRATIMGNRSFGKGSVQVVMPIDDETGIKLTTARYYTPSGRSIQATGITPDVVVSDTEKGDLFSSPREVDLDDHLLHESVPEKKAETKPVDNTEVKIVDAKNMYEFGSDQDFQLQQAIRFLKGEKVNQGVIQAQSDGATVSGVDSRVGMKHESRDAKEVTKDAKNKELSDKGSSTSVPSSNLNKVPEKALDKAIDKVLEHKGD
ncbi:carboxyl-terminal protease [Pelistega indica]|uniref:Carboxyl-terminal protease n=1 Tax=Pelistega indica TaxID=1414851 RepID=V8FSC2_9BURK|nr:S41 family peptidase [Pelistega indica]ETD67035.1 carboxyl-terminal protease [Pelistega indica]